MLDQALWDYCGCAWFYDRYQPVSPLGQRLRQQRHFFADEGELAFEHRLIELFLALLRDKGRAPDLDQIKGALSRLLNLGESFGAAMEADEIFIVKRFLFNAQLISRYFAAELKELFGFTEFPHALLEELGRAQPGGESFYVADLYDERLAMIRRAMAALTDDLRELKRQQLEAIKQATTLDFAGREFVIVSAARLLELSAHAPLMLIENHDGMHLIVRPLPSAKEIACEHELWRQRACEQAIEREVCAALGTKIAQHTDVLRALEMILGRLDVALTKATLAHEFGLVAPCIKNELAVVEGRLLPLEERCRQAGGVYTPLNMELGTLSALIYGSNMGGKSVVLKTIGFLQALTQHGFYVPAASFTTRLYGSLALLGSRAMGGDDGLSGFGAEVFAFQERWQGRAQQALFLIDEFASTTNAKEAIALNHALIATLSGQPGLCFLLATHFIKDGPLPYPVKILRMQGIDHARLMALGEQMAARGDPVQRVQMLNQCMTYKIVEQDAIKLVREALSVAAFLGLDPKLLAQAESQMEGADESRQT